MADDTKDDKANEEKDETLELDEDAKGDGEEDEDEKSDDKPDPELQKAIKRRDAAIARARKAEDALKEATKAKDGDDKPDPVEVANRRLVNASARTVLASAGITDKDDQKTILAVLNLSDIEVDDEDGPDEDAIEEKITDLRRILGGKAPAEKQTRRVPGSTSQKDKGGTGSTTDPDAARYRNFMSGRR